MIAHAPLPLSLIAEYDSDYMTGIIKQLKQISRESTLMAFRLILLAFLTLAINQVQAAPAGSLWLSPSNGETLNDMCAKHESDGSYYDPCTGFILGVADALTISEKICSNNAASTKQYVAIVKKYLRDNPEKWHYAAVFIVRDALQNPFKCS